MFSGDSGLRVIVEHLVPLHEESGGLGASGLGVVAYFSWLECHSWRSWRKVPGTVAGTDLVHEFVHVVA